jgi:hypothetical protein
MTFSHLAFDMPQSKRRVQLAKARQTFRQASRASTKSRSNRNQTVTPQNAADSSEEPLRDVGNSEELFDISEGNFDQTVRAFIRS